MAIESSSRSVFSQSLVLANKLFDAISKVKVHLASIDQLRNLACALQAYNTSKDINARYTPPIPVSNTPFLKNTKIYDTFHLALGKGFQGILETLGQTRDQLDGDRKSRDPIKQNQKIQDLSAVILASQEAITYVSRLLQETPDCKETFICDKCNP